MSGFANFLRIVILAAFVAGAFVPAISGAQQPDMDHTQMMSTAGHAASMNEMNGNTPDTQQIMLCKQYCMIASAVLPVEIPPAVISITYASLPRPGGTFAPSRVTAPPGRPPKIVMV